MKINPSMYVCAVLSCSVVSESLQPHGPHQVPLSMGFSRQESWSELPCPSLGDLPDAGTEPASLLSSPLLGGFFTASATWEAQITRFLSFWI